MLAAAGTLRFTVRSNVVDSETLYAALSTYLLAGLFFGQIYWAIEAFAPGSLVGPDPTTEATSVYYSFVTLATLGYGDYSTAHRHRARRRDVRGYRGTVIPRGNGRASHRRFRDASRTAAKLTLPRAMSPPEDRPVRPRPWCLPNR